jgi:hypothetical protein
MTLTILVLLRGAGTTLFTKQKEGESMDNNRLLNEVIDGKKDAPIDYTSDENFAPLIRWLKGEHQEREVGCWECGGTGRKRSVDNNDNRVSGYSPPGPPEAVSFEDCPLCHGRGTIRLREWTFEEFLQWTEGYYPHTDYFIQCYNFDRNHTYQWLEWLLDPPTLAGVIGDWLMSLAEKEER